MDPRVQAYLEGNKKWAQSPEYKKPIPFLEMQKRGREREDGTVIVVACTDPRVTPEEFLGMNSTNKATVVRTAGGRVHAAMSTLLVLSSVGNLGKKGTIMVVHHTDCGLQTASDDEIRGSLEKSADGEVNLTEIEFGSFEDPKVSVKDDVDYLRSSPYFKGMQVLGFVMDTESGILENVAY